MISREEFQSRHSGDLKNFLQSPCGTSLLDALGVLRPQFTPHNLPHLHVENSGAIRGYELAMRNILILSSAPPKEIVLDANYGVPTPKEVNPEEKK